VTKRLVLGLCASRFDFKPAHKSHELFQGRNVQKLITPFTADSGFDLGPPHLNPSKTPIQASFGRDGSPSRPLSQHKTGLGLLGERALPTSPVLIVSWGVRPSLPRGLLCKDCFTVFPREGSVGAMRGWSVLSLAKGNEPKEKWRGASIIPWEHSFNKGNGANFWQEQQ
jgi:hypothetical protein